MTWMKRIIAVVFLLKVFSSSAQVRLITLEEAIAGALQKNYDIILAKNDSAVAAIDYSYRNAAFIPQLNANAGIVWNNNNQNITLNNGTKRDGSGIKSNNINSQLALNWTLFDGMRMFVTRDKLKQILELGELTIRDRVVNTVADVISTYYNIVRQKQQLKAIYEQMSLDSERVRLAQYRLDIGVGIRPDLLQSKIDLNRQKSLQLQQDVLIEQLKEQLNLLTGIQPFTSYDVTDTIVINRDLTLTEVMSVAEKTNPGLLIAKKNIDIANLTLKERKADLLPRLSFNAAYNFNRNNNQTVLNPTSPLFVQNYGFNYGLTATIPILNNFNTRRLIKQAKWSIQYQGIVYESQKTITSLNVINAFQAYEQQKRILDLEEENILLAKENLGIVLQTYRLGAATLVALKQAEQSFEEAHNRLIAARYNAKISETELLRLSGQLIR
jgi:outer membrane protein